MGLALPPSLKAIWEGRIDFVGQERVQAWQQTALIVAAVRPSFRSQHPTLSLMRSPKLIDYLFIRTGPLVHTGLLVPKSGIDTDCVRGKFGWCTTGVRTGLAYL